MAVQKPSQSPKTPRTRASSKTLKQTIDEQSASIVQELEKLKAAANIQDEHADNIVSSQSQVQSDNDTRQRIAKLFIGWYFGLLSLIIIGVPLYNLVAFSVSHKTDFALNLRDLLQVYSSIVGPLVGFVIAYYFKNK